MIDLIPVRLRRCTRCGEYEGRGLVETYRTEDVETVIVTCLCDGIPCRFCKKNTIHRPCSNYFDEATGRVWHVPWFVGLFAVPCEECRANGVEATLLPGGH